MYDIRSVDNFFLIKIYQGLPEILKLEWPDYYLKWYVIYDTYADIKNHYQNLDNFINTLNQELEKSYDFFIDLLDDAIGETNRILRLYIYLVMTNWDISDQFRNEIDFRLKHLPDYNRYEGIDEFRESSIHDIYSSYIIDLIKEKINKN